MKRLCAFVVLRALACMFLAAPAAALARQDESEAPATAAMKFDGKTFGGLRARSIGPALMSGRIGDLAVNPGKPAEFYVAVASGNVWKTSNGGVTFEPIFDNYGSYSIGCVKLDPNNPHVVWVGTGENNSQRSVGWGDGVYVSRDGGKSFTNTGLKDSEHIGMIAIDPRNSDIVFVAAQGPLWRSGGDRGLYRSSNGGGTWTRVLYVSEETGINEVHMDPRDPQVMYASAYQRRRHVWTLINGGPESAIYKSSDGGQSWRKVGTGLPSVDMGRIGLAISPANPDVIYAIVEAADGKGGVFRSVDRGERWEKRSDYMSSSPQYYNELVADPQNVDRVYSLDTFLMVSEDGAATFRRVPIRDKHVDDHALWINPADTAHMLCGSDGGLYETFDRGGNWRYFANLPVTQFYRVAVDESRPFYFVYGGTQDNNSQGGPSRTTDRMGIANEDWFITVGGDGFELAIDPEDPNIIYTQWQHAGLTRFDRRSGETVDIKPREKPGEAPYVWNWDTPLIISPHDPRRLYVASRVLHRSDDRGDSWRVVSEDLTRGIDRNKLKVMGRVQKPDAVAKHMSTSIYGNCVALCESPITEGVIYVGTDDGLVHVTEDGGATWRRIENFPFVPEFTYVSDLEPSRHSSDTVFATFDNHKNGDFTPYVLRSEDRGRTWRSIAGDLPRRDTVYALAEDHVNPNLLFVGTEFGCYYTLDGGAKWVKVAGVPTIAVRDVEIQRRENDLVMATFGRGFYILDDYTPMRHFAPELHQKPAHIYPIKPAASYVERSRLGGTHGRGSQGASFYAAKNPPLGAVVTYHLKEKIKSRKELRQDAEKKEGWTYPTFDEFRAEDSALDPQVVMIIRDGAGEVVRHIAVSREAGTHRAVWNLRYPETAPVRIGTAEKEPWELPDAGILAPPGSYTVELVKIVDGVSEPLAGPEPFEVYDLNLATLAATGEARREKFEFERKLAELRRAIDGASRVVGDLENRITLLRRGILDTAGVEAASLAELEALRLRVRQIRIALHGDPTLSKRAHPEPTPIASRVHSSLSSLAYTTQPPTGTQREQYGYAADLFTEQLEALRLVVADLAELEKRLDAAGVPWTPGRLPDWRK